jgi:Zn finger protein HypA/HybF involved in hydrogenase expression
VRCACLVCGTHSNAVRTFRITGSCPNCGSFDLTAVEGAEPLGGPLAA